jgi:hypothetical protein
MSKFGGEFKNGAIHASSETRVMPKEASKTEEYVCPECKETVQLAKGPIIPPYFRHLKKTACAFYTNESEEHLTAKFMLKDFLIKKKDTPLDFKVERRCTGCGKPFYFEIYDETDCVEDEFSFQHNDIPRRADLACIAQDKTITVIYEICQTNATAVHARPEPWFEFDARHVIDTLSAAKADVVLTCKRTTFNTEKWDKCLDCEVSTGKIYFNQRGAGCGKTYESIGLLRHKDFFRKTTFIYLTKMRSAKKVIEDELKTQFAQNKFPSEYKLTLIQDGNQYSALVNDAGTESREPRNIEIYVGTIDSFTYALRRKQFEGSTMFKQIVCDLAQGNIKIMDDGKFKYANTTPRLSQNCLVIIDEAQDLEQEYIQAFQEITKKTNIDTYVIGDRLQSIFKEHNLFTYLNALDDPQIIKDNGLNVVMRFHNPQLKAFVNDVVPFRKYDLPEIEDICTLPCCGHKHEDDQPWHVDFEMPNIFKCGDTTNEYIRKLLEDMRQKVKKYGYLPNHFCFIFPIVKHTNQFITPLYVALTEFWDDVFMDDDMYTPEFIKNMEKNKEYWKFKLELKSADTYHYNHVIHHTSENVGTIDLTESMFSTRIMSIHASKGQGCECVYFLGLSDVTMGCFSDHPVADSLVFESLLHVGLTRCKKFIWVGITGMNGQMKRFLKYVPEKSTISMPNLFFSTKTKEFERKLCDEDVAILKSHVDLALFNKTYCQNKNKAAVIDWGHHVIRNAVMHSQIMLMFYTQCKSFGQAVHANFFDIIKCELEQVSKSNYGKKLSDLNKTTNKNRDGHKGKEKSKLVVPILCRGLRDGNYQDVSTVVLELAKSVQRKLTQHRITKQPIVFCPFEAIMHHHLTEMVHRPYNLTAHIADIYKLLSYSQDLHVEKCGCPCKKSKVNVPFTAVHDKITNHYKTIGQLEQLMKFFFKLAPTGQPNQTLVYILRHRHYTNDTKKTSYKDEKTSVEIIGEYNYYAETDESAVCVYLSPQLNSLNYSELLSRIVVDRFLLQKKHPEKKIYVYILTLDYPEPILVEFKETSPEKLNEFVKTFLINKYERLLDDFFEYADQKTWFEIKQEINRQEINRDDLTTQKYCRILPYFMTAHFDSLEDYNENYKINRDDQTKLKEKSSKKINTMFKI